MPDITEKLALELPKGNETVNRDAYTKNLNLIDQNAAAQTQVDEPFNLLNAVYDATGNKIDITFGKGQVTFLDVVVAKAGQSSYSIPAPQINSSYYVYIKSDGTFMHNTTAGSVTGAALIWKVATGSPVSYISVTDRRGKMSGTDAQALLDYVNEKLDAQDPLGVPKPCLRTDLPPFHLWCDGKTIGDASSGANSRANADVHDLFVTIWSATGLSIYESTGAVSARGASGEADWAAHKRLALPNMTDNFLRGPQTDRQIASYQEDAFQGHWHITATRVQPYTNDGSPAEGWSNYFNTIGNTIYPVTQYWVRGAITDGINNTPRITNETRPKNISCNWIMRY